jgi:hypothetical protein
MNRDSLKIIASYLRGDDLVAFTEVSLDCYLAVGQPVPVPEWDVYRAVRELDILALRRYKVDLYDLSRRFEFNILFNMHGEYTQFASEAAAARDVALYRLNKDTSAWHPAYIHECRRMDIERILDGADVAPCESQYGCGLKNVWREILYRNDPIIMQRIVKYIGTDDRLAYYVHSRGSLQAIKMLDSSVAFTAYDLYKNPHAEAVMHMICAMNPFDCFDEYTTQPLAEKILEVHGCTVELANHGLAWAVLCVGRLEFAQFWVAKGATNLVAAAIRAVGQCADWLMTRSEVQACADIVCAARISKGLWQCDGLIPFLKHPEEIASIACATNYKTALRVIPCGCSRHT